MKGLGLVLSVVDTRTGEAHRVGLEVAASHRRSGSYPALCGADVVSASLTTAASRQCGECAAGERCWGRRSRGSGGRSRLARVVVVAHLRGR